MNNNQICLFSILFALFFLVRPIGAEERVLSIVKSLYPGYKLITINDFDDLDKDFLLNTRINNNPGYVEADFDGNDLNDFAMILNKNSRKGAIFSVALQTRKNEYKTYEILRYKSTVDPICVFLLKPKTLILPTDAFNAGNRSITLQYPGIELVYIGKASIAYYWDKKTRTFRSITTGD